MFLGFGAYVSYYLQSRGLWNIRSVIGMGMAVVGIALWLLARIQLGKSFAVRAEAKALVTTGLYSKFRNPVYYFGGMIYLGYLIALGNWILLLVYLIFYSTFQLLRIKKEERVLEEAFGEEYRRYKASTWF